MSRSSLFACAVAVLLAASTASFAAGPSQKPSARWQCSGTDRQCKCENAKDKEDCVNMAKDAPCTGKITCPRPGTCICDYQPQQKK